MEDFEKELNEAKAKDDADEGEPDDGAHLEEVDEAELGDDPFARNEAPAGIDSGTEPWLGSDRDYTYPEVRAFAGIPFPLAHVNPHHHSC
jgi:translation initiation factor 2 subunit 2